MRDQFQNSARRSQTLLAHFGKEGKYLAAIPTISQETLAEMVDTTCSRVSFFMNRFRKLAVAPAKARESTRRELNAVPF